MVKFNTISDQCKLAQTYNLVPGGGEGEPVLVWAATFPTILENKFLYCAISLATFSPPSQRMFRNQRKKLEETVEETVELERMRTVIRMSAFSLPKAALLLVSTKNRELWEGPTPLQHQSRALEPRVLRLLGQRWVAGENSGDTKKYDFFDWLSVKQSLGGSRSYRKSSKKIVIFYWL